MIKMTWQLIRNCELGALMAVLAGLFTAFEITGRRRIAKLDAGGFRSRRYSTGRAYHVEKKGSSARASGDKFLLGQLSLLRSCPNGDIFNCGFHRLLRVM